MKDESLLRYSRHILLEGFDVEGQTALLNAHVLIVGAGGLGCPAAMYLAASGVGHITLIDDDQVELSNLQRQIGHDHAGIGEDKVVSLQRRLLALNPSIEVTIRVARLDAVMADELIAPVDLVLDCSDNFDTRFLVNRVCRNQHKPLVTGAAQAAEGQVLMVVPGVDQPCYECLFKQSDKLPANNCANSGVLAPIVGIVGSYQALIAIKYLAQYGSQQMSTLMVFDFFSGLWRQLQVRQDPECPCCH